MQSTRPLLCECFTSSVIVDETGVLQLYLETCSEVGRASDTRLREPGYEYCAGLSNLGHFSLHIASVL